jgi:hypothetical protein
MVTSRVSDRIDLMRIRIQHFFLIADPDPHPCRVIILIQVLRNFVGIQLQVTRDLLYVLVSRFHGFISQLLVDTEIQICVRISGGFTRNTALLYYSLFLQTSAEDISVS